MHMMMFPVTKQCGIALLFYPNELSAKVMVLEQRQVKHLYLFCLSLFCLFCSSVVCEKQEMQKFLNGRKM